MQFPLPSKKKEDHIYVVIETPRGSTNKYVYNHEYDCFELGKVLPFGTQFPLDFGFVPHTLGEDGQPVDALVLMEHAAYPGTLVKCRCIGVIEARQTEKGETIRNDRLICVYEGSAAYEGLKEIKKMNVQLLNDIIHFFEYYNEMEGKKFTYLRTADKESGYRLIRKKTKRKK
jgi:inorganic pyrophosphatase